MKQPKAQPLMLQYLLIAGGLLLTGYLSALFNLPFRRSLETQQSSTPDRWVCQEIVQPKASLSREQLAKLLSVPERSQRRNVRELVKEPYCQLPSLSIRAGAKTERHIYPLGFDPQTSLVVLYEGETYVGYGFKRF